MTIHQWYFVTMILADRLVILWKNIKTSAWHKKRSHHLPQWLNRREPFNWTRQHPFLPSNLKSWSLRFYWSANYQVCTLAISCPVNQYVCIDRPSRSHLSQVAKHTARGQDLSRSRDNTWWEHVRTTCRSSSRSSPKLRCFRLPWSMDRNGDVCTPCKQDTMIQHKDHQWT